MTTSLTQGINLEDFLKLPYLEDSPAWEYLDGVAIQKPMPKTRHSILQKRLLAEVDSHTADYTALPELRCTFGGRSIVPDVAVIAWNRINLNEAGEPEDDFTEAPDWTIEILSPDQKVNRVIDNILHCLKHGSKLGWMLDPDDYSVLMFTDQQEPEVCRGDHQLKVIAGVQLTLTPQQIFAWLKVGQARQSK
ncbi:MAG: Uma2 family endonuclease [Microcystis aeruginosa L111-01]|jgi:Uma2 family endonuclease|uniref:Uma2 family endonuclease n=1 Tax=Microcystis aeruginosa G11-04 TaxID=2685956 RepID=A0A966G3L9_MICAE|nr:Uma2 family endonuclease [Microcystis aeruginosa WS75]NCQ69503.1 Uma2 family endonuclease [Microcystis aeruginosa W13-16]NCQ74051.1 Uma2 family endonuclease [Microcystis aeruginosa W13-13]NCQ78515.1 Uma2 family endonuclease [Microcystis aeruginosa W13-15]NCR22337.1 Uma2 family endonuclease [Microcystis aeruginosa L111-01]NCS11536.1 Uma2 family endonuclease [Microcystis aeruginosa G13-09]NCS39708.1 Uma2 family endonuclease [Microcystis aeruginosa BS13-10]NCS47870.1 Uma2 family endonuclease